MSKFVKKKKIITVATVYVALFSTSTICSLVLSFYMIATWQHLQYHQGYRTLNVMATIRKTYSVPETVYRTFVVMVTVINVLKLMERSRFP